MLANVGKIRQGPVQSTPKSTAASTTDSQSQHRVRRRGRQRNAGPPQLQFVTATNPSQFKDEKAKRSVRSQAMMQYRYSTAEQKRTPKEAQAPSAGSLEKHTPVPTTSDHVLVLLNNDVLQTPQNVFLSQWFDEPSEPIYSTTSEAWWSANAHAESLARERGMPPTWRTGIDAAQCTAASGHATFSRYSDALAILPEKTHGGRVISYEPSYAHDQELLDIITATVMGPMRLDKCADPFSVFPQFKHPELNAVFLVRRCNRIYSSKSTLEKWLPVMLSDPHILLSSTMMSSTWLDMHVGICGESKRTVLLKQEAIGYINERLRDARAYEDSTLAVIIHVLAGEMWSCNEETLRIHQAGIARLIAHRGGMSQLGGDGVVAQVAASVTYHGSLICEETPLPLLHQWDPPPFTVDATMSLAESPLYCPRGEFFTVIQDRECNASIHDLLCDMRDLTDLFIAHNSGNNVIFDLDVLARDPWNGPSSTEFDAKVIEIRAKVASLPSARDPGLATTNDWVYEACRIAAIIYASAIIMRVPLSAAADPDRNIIMCDMVSLAGSLGITPGHTPRLTETLYEVLEKTNTGDLWNNMSGVFYWVTTVGAAAARTPVNIDMYSRPTCANEAYATWVRRCLIMHATRAMILFVFAQPLPLLLAEKKLLKVQELLGRDSSQTLVS